MSKVKKIIKKTTNYTLIFLCFLLSIFGAILPIIPGFIFLALGIMILSFEFPPLESFVEKHLRKDNKVGKTYFEVKEKFEKFLR
jgi:uncharacterized membrane protein YbaN (DUF454 family)